MSKKTIWTCDKCGKSKSTTEHQQAPDGFYGVGVTVDSTATHHGRSCPRAFALWCLECCEAMNIGPYKPRATNDPAPEPVSLEDLIREIAREEAEAVVGSS